GTFGARSRRVAQKASGRQTFAVVAMKFEYAPGATPIDADEARGLIPAHLTLQRELNEYEEANILEATEWLFAVGAAILSMSHSFTPSTDGCSIRRGSGPVRRADRTRTSACRGSGYRFS